MNQDPQPKLPMFFDANLLDKHTLSIDRLRRLADLASEIGLEVFLIDPEGLNPSVIAEIADHCAGLGMGFERGISRTDVIQDRGTAAESLVWRAAQLLVHRPEELSFLVTDWPSDVPEGDGQRPDTAFALRASILGAFTIGSNLDMWSRDDLQRVRQTLEVYSRWIRFALPSMEVHTLAEEADGWTAFWQASKDAQFGSIYAFRLGRENRRRFILPGLDPDSLYGISSSGLIGEEVVTGVKLSEGLEARIDAPQRSAQIWVRRMGTPPEHKR